MYNVRTRGREEILARGIIWPPCETHWSKLLRNICQLGAEARLSHLFMMSPVAQEIRATLTQETLWLLDATYNTNRYS